MKLIYLTTDDPIYLPTFFETVFDHTGDTVLGVYVAPPLYKNESSFAAALKYLRTFGVVDFAHLAARVALCKLKRRSISNVCKKRGIPCRTVADVNAPDFLDELKALQPDLIISVSCPQLFKKPLIVLPSRGILNLHGAILPHYRGVMPSFWMMANGEKKAGVSIYFVNEKIDAGDLCAQEIFEIDPKESLDHFIKRSKAIGASLLLWTLRQVKKQKVKATPLNLQEGSYYSWPDADAVKRFRATGRRLW